VLHIIYHSLHNIFQYSFSLNFNYDDIINNNINGSDDIIDVLLIDYLEVECKKNKEGAQNNY
jgi:hypothetical protein